MLSTAKQRSQLHRISASRQVLIGPSPREAPILPESCTGHRLKPLALTPMHIISVCTRCFQNRRTGSSSLSGNTSGQPLLMHLDAFQLDSPCKIQVLNDYNDDDELYSEAVRVA